MGLVDTAVVGRLGAAQLGALGLATSLLAAGAWVFNFLVFGTTSAVARSVGRGEVEVAGRQVAHAGQVALCLGATVGLVVWLAAPSVLRAIGAVEELVPPAVTYLRIRAVGIPLLLLGYVGHAAFRGVSDTRTPLGVAVAANLVNAALTLWLVLGVGLGIAGAAWATVVAEALVVAAFARLLHRTGLPVAGHGRVTGPALRAMLVVSRDLVLRTGGLVFGLLAIAAAAVRVDAVTAAAYQVLYQYLLLVSFLLDGVAIAGQAMVGTALGAGHRREARAVARLVLAWGMALGLVLAVGAWPAVDLLPGLLTDDGSVLVAVGGVWWLFTVGLVLSAPVYALDGVLMGAQDFAYLRTWTVLAGVAGGVAAQVAAGSGGELLALWWAVLLLMGVRLVSLVVRVAGSRWLTSGDTLDRRGG